jgi:hypothetical protein
MFISVVPTLQKKWKEIRMKELAGGKCMENDCFLRTLKFKMLLSKFEMCTYRATSFLNSYYFRKVLYNTILLVWDPLKRWCVTQNKYYFDIDKMKLPYGHGMYQIEIHVTTIAPKKNYTIYSSIHESPIKWQK